MAIENTPVMWGNTEERVITMMRKIAKNYIDTSCGFEIPLGDVEMKKIHGSWVVNINAKTIHKKAKAQLKKKKTPYTGAEIKYIRQSMKKTLTEFGEMLGVSHCTVLKWENQSAKEAVMGGPAQKLIRISLCYPEALLV